MKVSLNWLSQYVDFKGKSIKELDDIFSFQLIEIEEQYKLCSATNIMIGHVVECIEHPDSDHLHVCQVQLNDGITQIVCGAPNIAVNQKVMVALVGAVLPGDFKIKDSKIRGVESHGMICSLQELGFEEKYVPEQFKEGIFVLDNDAPVGENPLMYLGLDDYVFDLHLTPNRADVLSMIGVAYDLGCALDSKVNLVTPVVEEINKVNPVKVEIESDVVYQYHTRYIENVEIKDSPWWLKSRLIAAGIRPINNVVDITNYILMEYGQPLHSFDADLLGNKIVVKTANDGEVLKTLDGQERILTSNDIVITDGKSPVCLGGVMGGLSTEVTTNTKNIILEAAEFAPTSIRKTSARLQLRSDSSYRFERKIDSNRVLTALDAAAMMLAQLAGGSVYQGINGLVNHSFSEVIINTTLTRINSNLGTTLLETEVNDILRRLDFNYTVKNGEYLVNVPSRRIDYDSNEQDLFEDIARFYGYDNIPTTLASTSDAGSLSPSQIKIREVKEYFVGCGLNETISYSLIKENEVHDFTLEDEPAVSVMMPFTEDRKTMRQSIINGLVDVVGYNLARKKEDLHFFEISKVYSANGEKTLLSGALFGVMNSSLWQGQKELVDFYYVKGLLEGLFDKLGIVARYEASEIKNMHPYKTALIKTKDLTLGYIGEIHPKYAKEHNIKETYVFELDFNLLIENAQTKIGYNPISKYPSITRDLAIVCSKDISAVMITDMIKQTGKKNLIDLVLFDVYQGENVGEDEWSLAYKLTFMDPTKTLESSDVDKVVNQILKRLEFTYQAKLRS